jgi:sugar phosphate isomerase/epimerase
MKEHMPLTDFSRSYKKHYPFSLATTSFIYPDTWAANVRRLGPYVDEIELLILESGTENYPTPAQIKELKDLADEMALTYNIHLPMDIFLGHTTKSQRDRAVEVVRQVVELTADLPVSVQVLHAVWQEDRTDTKSVTEWQNRVGESFEKLIAGGIEASFMAVETLENYPLNRLDPVIFDLNLSICLDLGHLWLAGLDPLSQYFTYRHRTRILHLHGIRDGKDHKSLAYLDSAQCKIVRRILSDFRGVVSLELFDLKELAPSLPALETICRELLPPMK